MRHSGHHINDIPLDSIIGDTYAPILLKMDTTKPGDEGEHFGKRINNETNEGVEEWDFDKRYHLILDKVTQETLEFFNIEGTIDDWQKKHNQAMTRFFFWIVNYYNIPQEAITIPTIFEYGTRGTKKAQLVVGVPPFGNLTSAGVHLTLRHPKENLLAHTNSTCAGSKKVRCNNSYIDMGLQTHAKPMRLGLE